MKEDKKPKSLSNEEKQDNQNLISRRQVIKGSAFAAAGIAVGAISACTQEQGAGGEQAVSWDEEFDVVIIGSGFSGLAAAIEANKAGASAIVLDKMSVLGGNSVINGGLMAVPGSDLQQQAGVEDSPEIMMEDMLKAGLQLNHEPMIRVVAENALSAYEFCKEVGVQFNPSVTHLGGHSVRRSLSTTINSGAGYVRPMISHCESIGVDIRKQCKFEKFVKEDNRIIGVMAREGYRFPDENTGTVKSFKANKAVILATGGFSEDVEYRKYQDPRLTQEVGTTNHRGATAEGLREAFEIGAAPVQISWIQLGPWTSPDEEGLGIAALYNVHAGFQHGIIVAKENGKRFVNELADRKTRADAILKHKDNQGNPLYPVSIVDKDGAQNAPDLQGALDTGVVKEFQTIEELANHYGIPLQPLKNTIDQYNSYVSQGNDPDFGKPVDNTNPIETAPFYGCKIWPKIHHTMGGIKINEKAEVIDMETFAPIKGLYAAGEVCGGVHGASRLGSCATTDCIVFGRIAGQNAANASA